MRVTMNDLEYDQDQRVRYRRTLYSGTAYELYADGTVMTELTFHQGIPHGIARAFYPDGSIESEWRSEHGRRHGSYRRWHENGQLAEDRIYEHGKIVSSRAWDVDGTPVEV
jgi:antitoxin component YwqK of YwqJK toxin-antitoxin module